MPEISIFKEAAYLLNLMARIRRQNPRATNEAVVDMALQLGKQLSQKSNHPQLSSPPPQERPNVREHNPEQQTTQKPLTDNESQVLAEKLFNLLKSGQTEKASKFIKDNPQLSSILLAEHSSRNPELFKYNGDDPDVFDSPGWRFIDKKP